MRYTVIIFSLVLILCSLTFTCHAEHPVIVYNQKMTISFVFGDRTGVYSGQTNNGLPNGFGAFNTVNSEGLPWTYIGEWKNGHMQGHGETIWWSSGLMGNYHEDECIDGKSYNYGDAFSVEEFIISKEITDNINDSVATPIEEFLYASNGKEVRINAYIGNGGKVVIPDEIDGVPVTEIADNAFSEKKDAITSVVLPVYLKRIGASSFCHSESLTGVLVLPETLEIVGSHAFQDTGLSGLVVQSNCTLKLNSFANMKNLEFVYIKDGCNAIIDKSTFTYDSSLKTVIIPETVSLIADKTFTGSNYVNFYTPENSYSQEYAKKNFISCDTASYEKISEMYANLYS